MGNIQKIQPFKDLYAWQEGHKLILSIYEATQKFPKEELFGLTNQLTGAAVSITSTIAEGFRRSSYKEKSQFYSMALGSLTEIQNQLLIAKDIKYLLYREFQTLDEQTILISKITNRLIKRSKTLIHNS